MKSRILNLSLIAIAVAALTACGGGDDNTTTNPAEPTAPITPAEPTTPITPTEPTNPTEPTTPTATVVQYKLFGQNNQTSIIDVHVDGALGAAGSTASTVINGSPVKATFTADGGATWSGLNGGARYFGNGAVLLLCTNTSSSSTNIALQNTAATATLADSLGKTFRGHNCQQGGLDGMEDLQVKQDGSISVDGNTLSASQFQQAFNPSGVTIDGWNMKVSAYKIGAITYLVTEESEGSDKSRILYIQK
ncbi:MAG: hypothetical protein ITG01_06270 [Comamonas sp.]|nr:hypothetical protein [Comamonas sp.]